MVGKKRKGPKFTRKPNFELMEADFIPETEIIHAFNSGFSSGFNSGQDEVKVKKPRSKKRNRRA